jgi:hypothetical protein
MTRCSESEEGSENISGSDVQNQIRILGYVQRVRPCPRSAEFMLSSVHAGMAKQRVAESAEH